MNIEESKQQLETLIEAWQLNEADLNQTDIEAIKCLLEENKKLEEYCCKRNECSDRIKENHKLTGYEIIEELEKWLESNINELSNVICEDNMNRISTTYEETKEETYQKVIEKLNELKGDE